MNKQQKCSLTISFMFIIFIIFKNQSSYSDIAPYHIGQVCNQIWKMSCFNPKKLTSFMCRTLKKSDLVRNLTAGNWRSMSIRSMPEEDVDVDGPQLDAWGWDAEVDGKEDCVAAVVVEAEEEEEAVAPDEDGVAGRDDEVLCIDVADERFKAGVAEDGLDTSGQK